MSIELTLHLHHETKQGKKNDGALFVSDDGMRSNAKWLPKSQIEFEELDNVTVKVECPEWLAKEKGFI